jgi:hypothetical protein
MSSTNKPTIKIDWATHEAAKFACLNWHYSKAVPVGKLVKVGAWENGKYIGVVIFARGANMNMAKGYGLGQDECVELVRIALTKHITPVSKIASFAIRFLKKQSPGIRLIVSYADPEQGHHGGVYQAMNWIYRGESAKAIKVFYKGRWAHKKTVDDAGIDQTNLPKKKVAGKHTYLFPLDEKMRDNIYPLSKPYPKRPKQAEAGPPELRGCNTHPDAPSIANTSEVNHGKT